jgi:hypothetical protein
MQSITRITFTIVAVLALLFGATRSATAQSCPANQCQLQFSASVSISSVLSCAVTRGSMNLGNHFRSEGKVSADETTALRARCTIDPANGIVDVSFTLPSVLTRVGGTETLPITFGTESLRLYDADGSVGTVQGVNPAMPQSKTIASGFLTIAVGENGPNDPNGEVSVDLTNAAAAGAYTATITATVALR